MKNNGKSDYTIRFTDKSLRFLSKHVDLNNPEEVKQFVANHPTSNSYKRNLCIAYNKYAQYCKLTWEMPTYLPEGKQIRIPTTQKIEMLIARAGKTLGLQLSISRETGLRPIELMNLRVKDVDLEQRLIYPTTAKHGSGRILKISQNTQARLQRHITEKKLNQDDKLFKGNADYFSKLYRHMRNQLAKKLQDPTIKTIRLYDFRHYFATRLYAKTRDILLVKNQLGHKKIETTLVYTQLIHTNEEEEYTCRTAKDVTEASKLIEAGFQYVTDLDGLKLFKKRI